MKIRPRALPGVSPAGVGVHTVSTVGDGAFVHLEVDPSGVARGPMIRTAGPPHVVDAAGQRVEEQARQREGLASALDGEDSLLARSRRTRAQATTIAVVGCGNLGMNAGVRAVVGGDHFGAPGPEGGAFLVEGGHGRLAEDGEAPAPGGFLISGPRLVTASAPAPLEAATFADPRHLLLFPFVAVGDRHRLDFGLTRLLEDAALYRAAVAGAPLTLALEERLPESAAAEAALRAHPVAAEALQAALAVKGYRETSDDEGRGTYRWRDGNLEIAFLRGIYPHHVLALDAAGAVHSILVSGLSNRAGVHLDELAENLCAAGFVEALLMDNGGDVGLWDAREERFVVSPAEPDRAGRWPLTACFVYGSEAR